MTTIRKGNRPKNRNHDRDIRAAKTYANTKKNIMSPEDYKLHLALIKESEKL